MQKSDTLFSFEGLKVWQEARLLTKLVYQLTLRLPDYMRSTHWEIKYDVL